jgi:hypothetical protein
LLYFWSPPFKWCPSFKGPKFSLKFSLKANKGVCLFCKGFQPPCPNFGLFRNHCFFEDYSSFKFIITMLKFFDGMLAQSRFRFFLYAFKLAFIQSVHLLTSGPLGTVFEHLWNLFDLEDLLSGFSQLFLVCSYFVARRILGSISKALGALRLLALANPFGGIQLIVVDENLYSLWAGLVTYSFAMHL